MWYDVIWSIYMSQTFHVSTQTQFAFLLQEAERSNTGFGEDAEDLPKHTISQKFPPEASLPLPASPFTYPKRSQRERWCSHTQNAPLRLHSTTLHWPICSWDLEEAQGVPQPFHISLIQGPCKFNSFFFYLIKLHRNQCNTTTWRFRQVGALGMLAMFGSVKVCVLFYSSIW